MDTPVVTPKKTPKVITWDWKSSISTVSLQEALKEFGIVVFEVDTGADEYAIVIGESPMTQEDANAAYRKQCESELCPSCKGKLGLDCEICFGEGWTT